MVWIRRFAWLVCCAWLLVFAQTHAQQASSLAGESRAHSKEYEKIKGENSKLAEELKSINERLRKAEQLLRERDHAIKLQQAKSKSGRS